MTDDLMFRSKTKDYRHCTETARKVQVGTHLPLSLNHISDRLVNEEQGRNQHKTCNKCSDYFLSGNTTKQGSDVCHVTCG